MTGEWRSASAQVFVDSLDTPELDRDDFHHLSRVLRLRPGSEVCVTDGRGGWRSTSFVGAELLTPMSEVRHELAPAPALTVGFALVKGDKPELVVQKLTELGVDRIVPFAAQHSVVRWDAARAAKHLERLRRVARESCSQCRRLWLPEIGLDGSDTLPTVAQLRSAGAVMAQAGGASLGAGDTMVLVGPEGGWHADELEGASTVALGEHVLRAETAAITTGVLLTAMRAGVVRDAEASPP